MKISARLFLLFLAVLNQGLAQIPKTDDLLDEMEQTLLSDKASMPWWNKAWSLRRRVRIVDPGFDLLRGTVVVLEEPSPLLLYNTGRANRELSDLRVTDMAGKPLRCGVYRFGQDDGTSFIWVDLPTESGGGLKGPRGKGATFMLYYGNPAAPALEDIPPPYFPFPIGNPDLDRLVRPPLRVELSPEEQRPGAPARAAASAAEFFANTILLEAEDFRGPNGERVEGVYGPNRYLLKFESETASGRWYMAPDKSWHHGYVKQTYPIECFTTASLPTGGIWRVHVRYLPTQYAKPEMAKVRRCAPFTVMLGGREFRCGEDETPGARYRYSSFAVDLPAGDNTVGIRFDGVSSVDCLILTKSPDYLPDIADVNGPVWMRFQVSDPDQPPFFMELFCMIMPWSSHGPQGKPAGWLFTGRVETDEPTYRKLASDRELYLKPGNWTPWIQTLDSTMPLWWSNARVYGKLASRMASRTGLSLAYQFAMRPDEGRVFRQGTGVIHTAQGLPIIMSHHRTAPAIVRRTMTFDEWSAARFRRIQELKIEPVPKATSLYMNTMASAFSPLDAEQTARTLSRLGFNCLNLRCDVTGVDEVAVLDREGVPYLLGFSGDAPLHEVDLPVRPPAGGSALDQLTATLAAHADRRWTEIAARMPGPVRERLRVMKTGDEISAATSHHFINPHPFLLACYREFLQRQNLTPEFFGAASWDEVRAVGYGELSDKGMAYLDASLAKVDPDRAKRRDAERAQREEGESLLALGLNHIPELVLDDPGALPDPDAPPPGAGEAVPSTPATNAPPVPPLPPLFERRGYHYTQKFRSLATAISYGQNNAALLRHVSDRVLAAPNFQAMPCQKAQMWDGSINLFDMGRHPFGNMLLLEDWTTSPHKVAFGMSLLAAAGRKNQLALASYLVEGRMLNRALVEVGLGLRSITSYLYGPLRVIGPPWAENEETILQFAALNRWISTLEKELLDSTLRPADAALLVACTSEINARFFTYPLIERATLYALLQNARVPIEIVGEEEILEDDALSRYRLLFVVDPHVDSRVQTRIRDWVAGGGVLWAGPAAAAWHEFHEPSDILLDTLGLAQRPAPPPLPRETIPNSGAPVLAEGSNAFYGGPFTFRAAAAPPPFTPGAAEVLASFADGRPAILRHRFGKGQAFFHAFPAASLTDGYGRFIAEGPEADACRRLLRTPAEVAGVRPQVESDSSDLLAFVRDGTDFSLVVLANGQNERPVQDARIRVSLPFRPASVTDGQGAAVAFEADSDSATFRVSFAPRWGSIYLIRR